MFTLHHRYAELPASLWAACEPAPAADPRLIVFNTALARELGMDEQPDDATLARYFSGSELLPGARPMALGYAGHQFGNFVPKLGDGRALWLGEAFDADGERRDIQLKGSGRTPYSRGGDGRAPLGPVLREYLVSEAMAAMGIPTTRALAAVATGERVMRMPPAPGAVVTRVAASHIRVGTFQFAAARGDMEALGALVEHAIERHYPSIREESGNARYLALFDAVMRRQAYLVARWMGVGFIHGVMNTDNASIAGETIDYGPCAFMEAFDPNKVYSSIDQGGRYAFSRQPAIAQWNLARLAECLLMLMEGEENERVNEATAVLRRFDEVFAEARRKVSADKLGLAADSERAAPLMEALEDAMQRGKMDMTATFDALYHFAADPGEARRDDLLALGEAPGEVAEWLARWQGEQVAGEDAERLAAMRRANPIIIPRNHRVQEAISAAEEGDYQPFYALLAVVIAPFDDTADARRLAAPATASERVLRTFCGT
ncbi:protein adenylyltransferase SelO [Halomonas garicola]|uniref:protein adenylyltransferase SelO n=1 Tax=Halomonas garicola TaxID=1690008 RepID=UPI0028966665|nr:YdiU family protein [Halomonas garicola]